MPRVSDSREAHLRRTIRDALAIDPLISMRSLHDVVEKKINAPIDRIYMTKLVKRVLREIEVRPETETIENRIAQLRESNRIVREGLLKIAYPGATSYVKDSDKLRALELIGRMDNMQAKLEMDFGLYTRKLGEIDINHGTNIYRPDDDVYKTMVKAFENWGIAPPEMRKIEPKRIVNVESTNIPNEPTKPQPSATPAPTATPSATRIPITTIAGLVDTE